MRWYERKKFWVPGLIVVALLLLVVFGLDPVIEWQTRKRLEVLQPEYQVTFEDVSFRPTRLSFVLKGLKVMKQSAGGEKLPYFSAGRIETRVYGRELLHLHLVVRVEVDEPRLNLIASKRDEEQQLEPEVPDLSEKLEKMIPLAVDRIQVRDAALLFTDKTNPDFPNVWIHGVDATVENLATRATAASASAAFTALPSPGFALTTSRLIQEALAERGYLSKDHQTGELDAETSAALRRFQAAEEVARTGYPDRETVRKLGLSVARVFKGD